MSPPKPVGWAYRQERGLAFYDAKDEHLARQEAGGREVFALYADPSADDVDWSPDPPVDRGEIWLLAWVHSHADTEEPLDAVIVRAVGVVDLDWLDNVQKDPLDLARVLAEHVALDAWYWLRVRPSWEVHDTSWAGVEIIEVVLLPPKPCELCGSPVRVEACVGKPALLSGCSCHGAPDHGEMLHVRSD